MNWVITYIQLPRCLTAHPGSTTTLRQTPSTRYQNIMLRSRFSFTPVAIDCAFYSLIWTNTLSTPLSLFLFFLTLWLLHSLYNILTQLKYLVLRELCLLRVRKLLYIMRGRLCNVRRRLYNVRRYL